MSLVPICPPKRICNKKDSKYQANEGVSMRFLKGLFKLFFVIWVIMTMGKWFISQQPLETILKDQWSWAVEDVRNLRVFEEDK